MDVWMHVWMHECVSMYSYHILPTAIEIFRENHSSYATASLIAFSHIYIYIYFYTHKKNSIRYKYVLIFPLTLQHFLTALQSPQWERIVTGPQPWWLQADMIPTAKRAQSVHPPRCCSHLKKTTAWHKGYGPKEGWGYFWSFKNWWVSFEAWLGMVAFLWL